MGVQAACAAVAIEEGVHPGQAVVRACSHHQQGIQAPGFAVAGISMRQEGGHGRVRGRLVPEHRHILRAQLPRHHGQAVIREPVCGSQLFVQGLVGTQQAAAVQGLGLAGVERIALLFGLDVGQRQPLPPGDVGLR